MPEQEPLVAGDGGLFKRYLTHGAIDHAAWLRARAEHHPVGTCRACGADLHPEAPYDRGGGRIDYEACCGNPQCGAVLLAPRGATMHGSTAWSRSNGAARAAAIHRTAKEATD